jgi:16S rRNA (guanine527-N7)-methyltransferase
MPPMVPVMPPDHPSATTGASSEAERLRQAGLALGLALDEGEITRLLQYRDGLVRWNAVYNLTAVREPAAMLAQHLIDCLAIIAPLRRHVETLAGTAAAEPVRVLDVGSGGGLPGVVIALLQPEWRVTCVDAVGKKAAFIRQMAAELAVPNLQAVHARVENLSAKGGSDIPGFSLVTSRAFASLADFTGLTRKLLAPSAVWVAMKGQLPTEEQAALPPDIEVFHVEPLSLPGLEVQRCLVWMRPASPDFSTRTP